MANIKLQQSQQREKSTSLGRHVGIDRSEPLGEVWSCTQRRPTEERNDGGGGRERNGMGGDVMQDKQHIGIYVLFRITCTQGSLL